MRFMFTRLPMCRICVSTSTSHFLKSMIVLIDFIHIPYTKLGWFPGCCCDAFFGGESVFFFLQLWVDSSWGQGNMEDAFQRCYTEVARLLVHWSVRSKKQEIYCPSQKDDMDGFPSLHPIYRAVVAGIAQQSLSRSQARVRCLRNSGLQFHTVAARRKFDFLRWH